VNPISAVVTPIGPLNSPAGGTAADIAFLSNGTLFGWFGGAGSYGTINLATGQVTLLTSSAVPVGGVAVAPTAVIIGPNVYPTGTVLSLTANSQSPNAILKLFNTGTNTELNLLSLTGAPCCAFSALEISSGGTLYALAAGFLVTIPPSGQVVTLGALPAGVVALSFGQAPPVTVSVTPPTVTLGPSQSQTFTATVGGTFNTVVTWSIPGGSPGSINSVTGAYTAPASVAVQQNITVTATSQADPSKTGTATVTIVPIVVTVTPPTATLGPSQTQTFTANVAGSLNTAVTWSIPGGSPGSINASTGVYTAPASVASQQNVTVTATSQADPSKTATATVTLTPVTVTVTPATVSLGSLQTQQFTATVTGSANTAVTWSIPPGTQGTITASGLYTAPATVTFQTFTVTATSQANSSSTGTATVTLSPTLSTVPLPPTFWLAAIGLALAAAAARYRRSQRA
jgi:hypothetical protein